MRPDVEEFFCGISFDAYRLLGSHPAGPGRGWLFTLWAPHARRVQLLGDWNGWDLYSAAELTFCEDGLWRGRVPQAQLGQLYKYNIQGPDGSWQLRADPFAFAFEALPGTASRLAEPNYPFAAPLLRGARRDAPVLIYELHAASWHRHWDGRYYTGPELAKSLVPYLVEHHYTHVEFLPLAEYPFDGSWGYQGCGYFAPTQRIGGFAGFAALVDALHAAGIAVLMDFVPVHFAPDADRLACFDGAPLFESGPSDWGSLNFDLGQPAGAQLSAQFGGVLAAGVPVRRPAGGCHRQRAVPLPQRLAGSRVFQNADSWAARAVPRLHAGGRGQRRFHERHLRYRQRRAGL